MPNAKIADLLIHPASRMAAIQQVTAEIGCDSESLRIDYRLKGDVARLRLHGPASAGRTSGLWQHSCFEAFIRPNAGESYYEFNFAPSGDWAAYRFASRREGRQSPPMPAPRMELRRTADFFELNAAITLGGIPDLAQAQVLQAGLAAVIEDQDGALSYWALAHRSPRPDFHDPATFTLQVTR